MSIAECDTSRARPSEAFTVSQKRNLNQRLRAAPSPHSVPRSLPVLFFGDPDRAITATVGINPSYREYARHAGRSDGARLIELDGSNVRRFETLTSLGAAGRDTLSDLQCERAIETMTHYFDPGRPTFGRWFGHMNNVLDGMGISYATGLAVHLDLIQEATFPTWSELGRTWPAEAAALWATDTEFFRWQVAALPATALLCNGRGVYVEVTRILGAMQVAESRFGRLTWWASISRQRAKAVWVMGWNLPLVRPTGLGRRGEHELGAALSQFLRESGDSQPASRE